MYAIILLRHGHWEWLFILKGLRTHEWTVEQDYYRRSFYLHNESRINRDNVCSLNTSNDQIVTTDKDMANTLNTYFSSVLTHKQLNNIPQLPIYVDNTLNTFNFRLEDVQEKLNHFYIYKSTGHTKNAQKIPTYTSPYTNYRPISCKTIGL